MIDLASYFARVGYSGPARADLATLEELHARHAAAIPFENLDPLLGRPVPLDLSALEAKLVHHKRGGYCFEHNTLFAAVLQSLGFSVTPLAARVRWNRPDGGEGPRTHMLLRVELSEGSYLADVGFGGLLLSAPIRLELETEQTTSSGIIRLLPAESGFIMQARLADRWSDMYSFTLEPQAPVDYVVANWFTAAHPESLFTKDLLVQRLVPDRRLALFNRQLTVRGRDGSVAERRLETPGELGEALEQLFGITPPSDPATIWSRLPPA